MRFLLKYLFLLIFVFTNVLLLDAQKLKDKANKKQGKANQKVEEAEEPNLEIEALFIEASKQKIIGDLTKAKRTYLNVISKDEKNYAAMYELARLYYEASQIPEAIRYAKVAYEGNKENKWYKILLAELYNSNSNFKNAANLYKELTVDFPRDESYWQDYAYMLTQAGNEKDALKALTHIEKTFGIDENVARQKQQIYLSKGNTAKAAEQIENLILLHPTDERYYGLLADMYKNLGEKQKEINTYNRLLKIDPNNPYAFLELATIHKNEGNVAKFNEFISKAFANNSLDADSKIAVLYDYLDKVNNKNIQSQDSKLAFSLLKKLEQTHPNDAKVQAVVGDFYYKVKKYETALNAYNKSVKISPNSFMVWQQILFIHSDKGNHDALIKRSKEVIEIFPNQPLPYFFNGFANNRNKNYREAIKNLKQGSLMGSANKPLQVQIYTQLADSYNALKDHKNSDSAFDKAIKLDPNNTTVLNNYSYFLSMRGEKLETAEAMAKKANTLEPNNPSFQDTYAWVLYKSKKYDQAKTWLMKAYNNGVENNATILEHLGDVFYRLNQKNKALNYWKKALKSEGVDDEKKLSKKIATRKLIE